MTEDVRVRVLLLFGDQAEIVADAPDAGTPERYPASEISDAIGVPVGQLAGMKLTATVGDDGRLSNWRLA